MLSAFAEDGQLEQIGRGDQHLHLPDVFVPDRLVFLVVNLYPHISRLARNLDQGELLVPAADAVDSGFGGGRELASVCDDAIEVRVARLLCEFQPQHCDFQLVVLVQRVKQVVLLLHGLMQLKILLG